MRDHHSKRDALPELRVIGTKEGASFQVIVLVSQERTMRSRSYRWPCAPKL